MKQNESSNLKERIRLQSVKQEEELIALRVHAQLAYESLKPLNVIKKGWEKLSESNSISGDVVGGLVGLSMGYLSKKVLLGSSQNPVKKLLGTLAQFAIATVVSKYGDTIKSKSQTWLTAIFSHKTKLQEEFAEGEY